MNKRQILSNLAKLGTTISLAAMLTGCGKEKINVSDYITIKYEGYNKVATADYTFDYEKMVTDNLKAFGLDDESDMMAYLTIYSNLSEVLNGSMNQTDNISNGDIITFTWNDSTNIENLEEKYSIDFILSDKSLTVEGLESLTEFNPFDYITITYDGIAPLGTVKINVNSDIPVSGIRFDADKTSFLSNGDTITITAKPSSYSISDLNELCIRSGMYSTKTTQEYTIEGLSSYVSKLDTIPEDIMTKLDEHAQDTLKAYVANNWAVPESLENMELIGNYLLYPKDSSIITYPRNRLYFVYEITAKNVATDESFTYYYYSYYTDIMILSDGTCSYNMSSITVPTGGAGFGYTYGEAFFVGDYYYLGYEDLDSLFFKHVTGHIDSYSYESTVEPSDTGK